MKVLIIDDLDFRHEGLAEEYSEDTVHHAWNSKEAKEKISSCTWDLICFDYELGELEENGASIARWMVENGLKCREVRIHSANLAGGMEILSIIKSGEVSEQVYLHEFIPNFWK